MGVGKGETEMGGQIGGQLDRFTDIIVIRGSMDIDR